MPTANDSVRIPAMEGAAEYPRRNGEPVFDAPWQSRAFGMVVNLHTQGVYPWDDFKVHLIERIRNAQCAGDASAYYDQWVDAFSRLLVETSILSEEEILRRTEEFATGVRQEVY